MRFAEFFQDAIEDAVRAYGFDALFFDLFDDTVFADVRVCAIKWTEASDTAAGEGTEIIVTDMSSPGLSESCSDSIGCREWSEDDDFDVH